MAKSFCGSPGGSVSAGLVCSSDSVPFRRCQRGFLDLPHATRAKVDLSPPDIGTAFPAPATVLVYVPGQSGFVPGHDSQQDFEITTAIIRPDRPTLIVTQVAGCLDRRALG